MSLTRVAKVDPLNIEEGYIKRAADILTSGGLVIIPTETVYGIAAIASNRITLKRLCEIKERPKDQLFSIAIDKNTSASLLLHLLHTFG